MKQFTNSFKMTRICIWFILFASFFGLTFSLPSRIHVGGIFESDDDEIELVFRIAVDWLNTDEKLQLTSRRMVAMVEKMTSQDSLKTTELCCGLLQKGITAIFGPQSDQGSMHVQSICDDLEVPHVEARWEYRVRRDQLSINLYPHPTVLSNAIMRLVTVFQWEEFYILFEEDDAVVRLKGFIEEGEKQNWKIHFHKFENGNYREVFWNIKQIRKVKGKIVAANEIVEQRFLLDVNSKNLYTVLKSAQQVGMMTEYQKYIITSLNLHTIDLEDFKHSNTNITTFRLVQEDSPDFQRVLDEVNSRLVHRRDQQPLKTLKTESALIYDGVRHLAVALEEMDKAKNVTAFPPISCINMNKGIDGTSLNNFMKNGETSGLTGRIKFDSEGFRSSFTLDILYLTKDGLQKIGTILENNEVNITSLQPSSEFYFLDFENHHFKVATAIVDPYTMFTVSSQKLHGNNRFEGYAMDLLDALAKKLRFTYEIVLVTDKPAAGKRLPSGKWTGMIGRLLDNRADLAIADFTITAERLEVVDFTHPFMQTGIGILFRKATQKVTSLFSFLLPFSGEVWVLVMAAYTFISLSYFLVGRLSPYEWSNPHPCRQNDQVEENIFSLLNSMWFAIGSLMQQGSDIAPTAMSTRAVTSIWYFFCLIMISSYTANLAAFLTVENIVSPINNVDDLAKQEKIKYGCVRGGSTYKFFENSNMTIYKKMFKFMKDNADETFVESNAQGIERVMKGNYAYLMEVTSIEYKTERICNLTQVGNPLDSKAYGIAVNKTNKKLRDWISSGILSLSEEGQLHTFKERWWKQKHGGGQCKVVSSGTVTELGLGNVGGVFVVMVLGIILSACMGVVEFLWFQRKLQRTEEDSLFKLLIKEIKYAITCGSSSKPAPKLKKKVKEPEESSKRLENYNSFY